ncbi:MAG: hypothetical protein WBW73_22710 [Rhodoplanes sp.]
MKKDPRVAELVGIIGRDRARVDLIEKAIADFDRHPKHPPAYLVRQPTTKAEAKAFKRLVDTLACVERVLKDKGVRRMVERAFDLNAEHAAFLEWEQQLKHYREGFDGFARWPLGKPHGHKHNPKSPLKYAAARAAAALLKAHNKRLTKTPFCSVAAALYGDPKLPHEHFEYYCDQFLAGKGAPSSPPGRLTGLLAPGGTG